jgi:hypothetical protein
VNWLRFTFVVIGGTILVIAAVIFVGLINMGDP